VRQCALLSVADTRWVRDAVTLYKAYRAVVPIAARGAQARCFNALPATAPHLMRSLIRGSGYRLLDRAAILAALRQAGGDTSRALHASRDALRLASEGGGRINLRNAVDFFLTQLAHLQPYLSMAAALLGDTVLLETVFDHPEVIGAVKAAVAPNAGGALGSGVSDDELRAVEVAFDASAGVAPLQPLTALLARWNASVFVWGIGGEPSVPESTANYTPLDANDPMASVDNPPFSPLLRQLQESVLAAVSAGYTGPFDALARAEALAKEALDLPPLVICASVKIALDQVRPPRDGSRGSHDDVSDTDNNTLHGLQEVALTRSAFTALLEITNQELGALRSIEVDLLITVEADGEETNATHLFFIGAPTLRRITAARGACPPRSAPCVI
jgi:hypothetical protein